MNYIDIVLLIPLLFAAYKGFSKGIISQAAALAALILGIIGAIRFSDVTADFLVEEFSMQSDYLAIISFAVTFIIIVILVHFIARIVNRLIKAVALGFLNRLMGMFFSVLKVSFIISIILVLFIQLNLNLKFIPKEKTEESVLFEPLAEFAPMVFPYLHFEGLNLPGSDKQNKKGIRDKLNI